jgi:hypothetical protein
VICGEGDGEILKVTQPRDLALLFAANQSEALAVLLNGETNARAAAARYVKALASWWHPMAGFGESALLSVDGTPTAFFAATHRSCEFLGRADDILELLDRVRASGMFTGDG